MALIVAFLAGVAVDSWLRVYGPPHPAADVDAAAVERPSAAAGTDRPLPRGERRTTAVATAGSRGALRPPLDGYDVEKMKGGFAEHREGHPHEAVDLLAPRNTPVHAVDDGTVAKLFTSKAGGLTIYQFDPSGRLCYYYAHLQRYADGLHDGDAIQRGQVIGYVGTSGNAPPDTPHLHFAVFELDGNRQWWKGTAIDPYPLFQSH